MEDGDCKRIWPIGGMNQKKKTVQGGQWRAKLQCTGGDGFVRLARARGGAGGQWETAEVKGKGRGVRTG